MTFDSMKYKGYRPTKYKMKKRNLTSAYFMKLTNQDKNISGLN